MKSIRICMALAIAGLLGTLASCGSKDPEPTPTVKFTSPSATYSEDVGSISVEVTLSKALSAPVTINYSWSSPDSTAFYGGDFTITSPASLTIPAGATTGNITIDVIDDLQLDGDENNVLLTLGTGVSVVPLEGQKTFALTITNDDEELDGRLQFDMYWVPKLDFLSDINDVDLDISFQENAEYTWNQDNDGEWYATLGSEHGDVYTESANQTGFETAYLNAEDKDQTYFIFVKYVGGTGAVNFVSIGSGLSYFGVLSSSFTADQAPDDSGYIFKYAGPFTKDGDTFARLEHSGRTSSSPGPIKWRTGTGRITH